MQFGTLYRIPNIISMAISTFPCFFKFLAAEIAMCKCDINYSRTEEIHVQTHLIQIYVFQWRTSQFYIGVLETGFVMV